MKRFLALTLAILMLFSLVACNQTEEPAETTAAPSDTTLEQTDPPATEPPVTDCAHTYTETVTEKPKALWDGSKTLTCSVCGDTKTEAIPATKTLKVLAIGNSFSQDATEYLWDIAKDGGVEKIIIGNLYIGGCALDKHYSNIKANSGAYKYYKNTNGRWTETANVSVLKGLQDEEWDIVTVQQASGSSGVATSYAPLAKILEFLAENEPNADVYWHLTWAYQQNSTHSSFPTYGSDQMKMYDAILKAYDSKVKVQESIVGTIPSGTAVQNLRSSYIGDTITRDGYHMSYDYGRYTVALTWFAYLTGGDVDKVDWLPKNYATVLQDHLPAMREAVKGALAKPFEVTKVTAAKPASFPTTTEGMTDGEIFTSLGLNIADYEALDWLLEVQAYYNSKNQIGIYNAQTSSASNVPNFIASKLLTKAELPVGSVIIVDSGYQYRPEGWVSETSKTSPRPGNVTTAAVQVTEAWWGNYTIRAFNLSAVATKVMTDEDVVHLRIYVPKK